MKDDPNTVYVPLNGEDDPKIQKIWDWLKLHGHQYSATTNNWRKLLPNQSHASHGYLLGKWIRIIKSQKGLLDHTIYDPSIILLFKLTWGGV